jgi:hypothetical protein
VIDFTLRAREIGDYVSLRIALSSSDEQIAARVSIAEIQQRLLLAKVTMTERGPL